MTGLRRSDEDANRLLLAGSAQQGVQLKCDDRGREFANDSFGES